MLVDPSFIISQIDAAHQRFTNALQQLKDAKDLERQFLLEDLSYSVALVNRLKETYPQFITGQSQVRCAHMTGRSVVDWLAFTKVDHKKSNLVKTY